MSRVKYEPQRSAAEYRAMSRGDDPNAVAGAEHERPMPVDHAEVQRKVRAEDEVRADLLLGAEIGPWRVGAKVLNRYRVTHGRDGSNRLLTALDLVALAEGAKRNGRGVVRAQEPEPPKPIQPVPHFGVGDVTTKGWE